MSIEKISSREQAQFNSLRDKILAYDQDGLYDELLYKGGSHLINKYTDDLKSLMLYAIVNNNRIAFDMLFVFGFRWNEESAALIRQQLASMASPLAPEIYDRLIDLQLGCYQINSDLRFSKPTEEIPETDDLHYKEGNLEINLATLNGKKYQFKEALRALTKIPEIAELISQAFNGKPFQVAFVSPEHLYSEGDCNYVTKTVRIANNLSIYQMLTTMVFELCNAVNTPLSRHYTTHFANADDYALAAERLEYQSHLLYIQLLTTLAAAQDFSLAFGHDAFNTRNRFQHEIDNTFRSFDHYWEIQNDKGKKAYSHSEYYRIFFRQYQHLNTYRAPVETQPEPVDAEKITIPEIKAEINSKITTQVLENIDPIVPGFQLVKEQAPSLTIESHFTSVAAKAFFDIIKQNATALALVAAFQIPMAQSFAAKIDEAKLNVFRRMNGPTQIAFLERYALSQQQKRDSTPVARVGC